MDVFEFSNLAHRQILVFREKQKWRLTDSPEGENVPESEWWERFLEYLDLHEVDGDFDSKSEED